MLDYERLDVYQTALEFMVVAHELIEALPRGSSALSDQLSRASTSIILNIAEGAGKVSKPDKRRYYLTARGSAAECAAVLDILAKRALIASEGHDQAKQLATRIISMLVKLAQSQEPPSSPRPRKPSP